jgi:NAD(P)H dehydrogenase (quinone)
VHVYVVFAHPSRKSFTWTVLNSFLRGLQDAGHSFEVGDLYEMNFQSDLDPEQYERETSFDPQSPLPGDVKIEQEKLARADALAFVYPVWWSDCPAKLKGWFDRVWSYGYAYVYEEGEHAASQIGIDKALVICPAGHTEEHLEEIGIADSMRRVMVNDRLLGVGVREARMEILGGMVATVLGEGDEVRRGNLERAYALGREF